MKEVIRTLPQKSGVYFFLDNKGTIIYIGKAKNLKKRVASHFRKGTTRPFTKFKVQLPPPQLLVSGNRAFQGKRAKTFSRLIYNQERKKREKIISKTTEIKYILTKDEEEALILEGCLIAIFRPEINRAIGKFPFIEVTIGEAVPRVLTGYQPLLPESLIFGPFNRLADIDLAVEGFLTVIPICNSLSEIKLTGSSAVCLRYYIHRCIAPCNPLKDNLDQYLLHVENFINELRNNGRGVIKKLESLMEEAVRKENFEGAAKFRDKIEAIKKMFDERAIPSVLATYREIIQEIIGKDSHYLEMIDNFCRIK